MSNNGNWGNGNSLPVPADRPINQMIDPRSVGVPGNIPASDGMRPYVAEVLYTLIENIQSEAQLNCTRTFVFNMYGQRSFQNDMMFNLLKTACNIIDMQMTVSNGNAPIYDVIRTWCERIVKYIAAISMRDFPPLQAMSSQDAIAVCQNIIVRFDQEVTDLERALRGNGGWQTNNNNNSQRGNSSPAWQQASGGGQTERVKSAPMWVDSGNRNTQQRGNSSPAWQQNSATTSSGWPQTQSKTETTMSVQAQTPVAQSVTFIRSDEFPYNLVYDPNTYTLSYEANEAFVEPIAKRKPVDKQAHIGRPSFTPEWVQLPKLGEVLAVVEESSTAVGNGKIVELVGLDNLPETLTIEEGWRKAHAATISLGKQGLITCGVARLAVVDGLVSKFDVLNLIKTFTQASDHGQLVGAIKKIYDAAGKEPDARQVLDKVVARLTKFFNHYIEIEMGLPYGNFENYLSDVLESEDFINRHYGEEVGKVFRSSFRRIVDEALGVVDSSNENYAQLVEQYMLHLDLSKVHVGFFLDSVLLAQVELTSAELCAEMPEGSKVAMIREGVAPIFFSIAKSIIDCDDSCSTRLLKTADGVVFELSRGAFNSAALLVSRPNL